MRTKWILLLLVFTSALRAQEAVHEITLYTFSTMRPILWDNPSTLYKTAKSCFYKTLSLKDNYLLGHMVVHLSTPLLPQDTFVAMTAGNKMQRVNLILKDKIGLAILGATLEGKLESAAHIRQMMQIYAERRKIGFITFKVSKASMSRMLDFLAQFSRQEPGQLQPSKYYGGFYWPLYQDEGAGCSAFALGLLAAGSVLPDQAREWLKDVNIPMTLIGGEYRRNKRIPFARIKRTKSWYVGEGMPNIDFVNVKTYDPSVLLDWILQKRLTKDAIFVPVERVGMPGLMVDCTAQSLPETKPYFVERKEPNLFLDIYRKKLKQDASQPTP
jgi:hypothetical protein